MSRFAVAAVIVLLAGATMMGLINWRRVISWVRGTAANAYVHASNQPAGNSAAKPTGSATANAQTCRDNLRRLESAKRSVATKTGNNVGNVSWDDVLQELRGRKPTCPEGGTYILGSHQVLARCNVGNKGTTDSADDHIISKF